MHVEQYSDYDIYYKANPAIVGEGIAFAELVLQEVIAYFEEQLQRGIDFSVEA